MTVAALGEDNAAHEAGVISAWVTPECWEHARNAILILADRSLGKTTVRIQPLAKPDERRPDLSRSRRGLGHDHASVSQVRYESPNTRNAALRRRMAVSPHPGTLTPVSIELRDGLFRELIKLNSSDFHPAPEVSDRSHVVASRKYGVAV
jgi:hypothetical protein